MHIIRGSHVICSLHLYTEKDLCESTYILRNTDSYKDISPQTECDPPTHESQVKVIVMQS